MSNEFAPGQFEAAAWIAPRLDATSPSVAALVPKGYESYVRLLNPVEIPYPGSGWSRWQSVAKAIGMRIGADTSWDEIETSELYSDGLGEPLSGSMPEEFARRLAARLGPHTAMEGAGHALMWSGYAEIPVGIAPLVSVGPETEMYIFSGGLSEISAQHWGRVAMHWWPDDHAWYVGGDVYGRSIYIGGSHEAVDPLLDEFEGLRVTPTTRVPFEP